MNATNMPHRPIDEPCADFVSLIVRAADESIDAPARARLDAHLAGCEACRVALEVQQGMHRAVAQAYEVDPPLGFATRVLAHVEPTGSWIDRLDFRRWTMRVGPVAAGLLLAATLAVATEQPASAIAALREAAPAGDIDGSAVSLSDVMTETDLVTLMWEAETSAGSIEEVTP